VPLQHRLGRGVCFLQIDAPIPKLLKRNSSTGHGTAHERAGAHDAEIAIQVFDLGLAGRWGWTIGTIKQMDLRRTAFVSWPGTFGKIIVPRAGRNRPVSNTGEDLRPVNAKSYAAPTMPARHKHTLISSVGSSA